MRPNELQSYESTLLEMRARLIHEVEDVENAIREAVAAPGGGSTVPTHPADAAAEGLDSNLAVAQNEEWILQNVEAALQRIEDGTYGTCQGCGKEIPAERLQALPFTPCCVNCAQKSENG